MMAEPNKKYRRTVDMTDFEEDIQRLAKQERRSISQMAQVLLQEAINARNK